MVLVAFIRISSLLQAESHSIVRVFFFFNPFIHWWATVALWGKDLSSSMLRRSRNAPPQVHFYIYVYITRLMTISHIRQAPWMEELVFVVVVVAVFSTPAPSTGRILMHIWGMEQNDSLWSIWSRKTNGQMRFRKKKTCHCLLSTYYVAQLHAKLFIASIHLILNN